MFLDKNLKEIRLSSSKFASFFQTIELIGCPVALQMSWNEWESPDELGPGEGFLITWTLSGAINVVVAEW